MTKKITEEEFRLILSEVDNFNQMKNEIRGRRSKAVACQKMKKTYNFSMRETKPWLQPAPSCWKKSKLEPAVAPEYFLLASLKPSVLRPVLLFLKKDRPALNELVQADISTLKRPKASRVHTAYLDYWQVGDTLLTALCSSHTLAALVAELRERAVAGEPQK